MFIFPPSSVLSPPPGHCQSKVLPKETNQVTRSWAPDTYSSEGKPCWGRVGGAGRGGAGRAGTEMSPRSWFTSSLLPCSPLHPTPSPRNSNTPHLCKSQIGIRSPASCRSSGAAVPGSVGEGARNAGAEAWAAPDRAGSEFWECLCSWSPLGEGAAPLINPSLVPREGPGPCTRVEGDGALLLRGVVGGRGFQPPAWLSLPSGAWRSGALRLARMVHMCVCGGQCVGR